MWDMNPFSSRRNVGIICLEAPSPSCRSLHKGNERIQAQTQQYHRNTMLYINDWAMAGAQTRQEPLSRTVETLKLGHDSPEGGEKKRQTSLWMDPTPPQRKRKTRDDLNGASVDRNTVLAVSIWSFKQELDQKWMIQKAEAKKTDK